MTPHARDLAGLAADALFAAADADTAKRAGAGVRNAAFAAGRIAEVTGVAAADRAAAASALAPMGAVGLIVLDPGCCSSEAAADMLAAWGPGPADLADPVLAAGAAALEARARGEAIGLDARGRPVSRPVAADRPSMIPVFALDGLGPVDRRHVALGARAARELAAREVAEKVSEIELKRGRGTVAKRLDLTVEIDELTAVARRIAATAVPTADLLAATAGPAAAALRTAAIGDLQSLDPAYASARADAIDALRAALDAVKAVDAATKNARNRRAAFAENLKSLDLDGVDALPPAPWKAADGQFQAVPGDHLRRALEGCLNVFK